MPRASETAARKHVLLVEDDPSTRETLQEVLEDEGYEVTVAGGGFEALLKLEGTLPDVVLLDLVMSMMSGWEFRRRMLADPRLAGIPTILISAAADLDKHAATLSVVAAYGKPLDLGGLLDTLASVARPKRQAMLRRGLSSLPAAPRDPSSAVDWQPPKPA
jgi:two-component system, chemotaxis family, chemotaxis protein CheY